MRRIKAAVIVLTGPIDSRIVGHLEARSELALNRHYTNYALRTIQGVNWCSRPGFNDLRAGHIESLAKGPLMIKRTGLVLVFVASTCIAMAAQSEPALLTLKMPRYTLLARQARVQGVVKVAFTLLPHSVEPTDVQVVSAPPDSMGTATVELKRTALENVKAWRFENGDALERRYETTFEFKLDGATDFGSFQSFHRVTIVAGEGPVIAN